MTSIPFTCPAWSLVPVVRFVFLRTLLRRLGGVVLVERGAELLAVGVAGQELDGPVLLAAVAELRAAELFREPLELFDALAAGSSVGRGDDDQRLGDLPAGLVLVRVDADLAGAGGVEVADRAEGLVAGQAGEHVGLVLLDPLFTV